MSAFNLSYDGGHLECPHCKKSFAVEWNTEYGDPMVGEHEETCLSCGGLIQFDCSITYTVLNQTPKPKS